MRNVNLLKENGFNVDSVMESFGTMEMYDEILNDFINGETIEKLIKFKETNDMPNYSIIVHNLKGECMYLGIEKLANMALEHQMKSEANDMAYINENFEILMSELRRIHAIAKIYLGSE